MITDYEGNDEIHGGSGNDRIIDHAGNDEIHGGDGNDGIHAEGGDDHIDGGSGDDSIWTTGGNDTVYGRTGDDIIASSTGRNKLFGNRGNDRDRDRAPRSAKRGNTGSGTPTRSRPGGRAEPAAPGAPSFVPPGDRNAGKNRTKDRRAKATRRHPPPRYGACTKRNRGPRRRRGRKVRGDLPPPRSHRQRRD